LLNQIEKKSSKMPSG